MTEAAKPNAGRGFAESVAAERLYLLKFARLQLRNDTWAEDAVSETLLAAVAKPHAFERKSQLRTWLVGILKHKVMDCFRAQQREVLAGSLVNDEEEALELDALGFIPNGHFAERPADWGNPDAALQEREFMAVMDACVQRLPEAMGRLFLMREWLEMESDEICKELQLSSTNLYVQLHRARLRLRECLELNWFGQHARP